MAAFDFRGFVEAMKQRDVEGFLAFLSEDVEIFANDEPQPFRGKALLRKWAARSLDAIERLDVELVSTAQQERTAAALMRSQVKYRADVTLPDGTRLPVGGRSLDVHGALFLNLDEAGKVTRMHSVRDSWSVMKQLGIGPDELERAMRSLQEAMGLQQPHA